MPAVTPKYEMELIRRIYDNKSGDNMEVGPDADGLDIVEVRLRDNEGKVWKQFTMPPEQAKLVGQAIIDCASDMEKRHG